MKLMKNSDTSYEVESSSCPSNVKIHFYPLQVGGWPALNSCSTPAVGLPKLGESLPNISRFHKRFDLPPNPEVFNLGLTCLRDEIIGAWTHSELKSYVIRLSRRCVSHVRIRSVLKKKKQKPGVGNIKP
jgi:hypothetical protein